jgi:hypothetical protein
MFVAAAWPVWLAPWEWSSSDWAGLTFLVLVAAGYVAWRQAVEARRLREEQARPFVLIDFEAWQTIIELKITNTGRTLARNVRFEFDPPLASTHDESGGRGPLMELNIFKNGIPSLAPGKDITIFFDRYPARAEKKLPMTYSVHVSYTDTAGKHYSEPFWLDLTMYLGTGGVTRHGLHDIHKQLKVIADTLKKWTDYSGLKVMTRADIKERNAEWEAEYRERQAAADAEEEAAAAAAAINSGASDESAA